MKRLFLGCHEDSSPYLLQSPDFHVFLLGQFLLVAQLGLQVIGMQLSRSGLR